ncbi:unnamed protein product [Blepharisma stoltei]|uniref:Tetratricopeptide repeat protein n=1 Tax=Blepharisma stoltei TaxID=1481888 RepID=A0AAU9JHT4_9CILI|nr:unnamed protein product [Blepharisma stoltei]
MSIKPQAPNNPNKTGNVTRVRYRSPSRQSRASPHGTSTIRKRFTPSVNKTFSPYDDISIVKNRSTSADRHRYSATAEPGKLRTGTFRATSRLSNFLEEKEAQLEHAKFLLKNGMHKEAIQSFEEILKNDKGSLDALYGRGVCYMHLNDHKTALADFLAVEKENSMYDKQLYLALSSCFSAMGDIPTSLRYISKGLSKFPKFVEGYIVRAHIHMEQQQWEKALSDFQKALGFNSAEIPAVFGIVDCLHAMGDNSSAFDYLKIAASVPKAALPALLKRAKLNVDVNQQEALEDFDKYLSHCPEDSEGYFEKAQLLYSLKEYPESALCFEQAIKFDRDFKYTSQSVFYLGAIKIREKDFYGALYTFKRSNGLKEMKQQTILRNYAEAVICMMKRKYKEGIAMFSKLIKKEYPILKEYQGNCYCYRAYGYNALNQHENALHDFKKAMLYTDLDKASKYNQKLSQGYLAASKGDNSQAMNYFKKAHGHFPKNLEPQLYQACLLVQEAFSRSPISQTSLTEAESLIDRGTRAREIESEAYFFRSVIKYLTGKFKEAFEDAKTTIEKAEDNHDNHYIIRGLIHASLKMYKEAIQDFRVAQQLSEELGYLYSYRGRCSYLMGDTNLAFSDFQKLMLACPKDKNVHIEAGNFLILTGLYEDALDALDRSNRIELNFEATYQKLKCYILLNKLDESIKEIERALALKPNKKTIIFDKDCLLYIKEFLQLPKTKENFKDAIEIFTKWLTNGKGDLYDEKYIYWLRGVFYMYTESYSLALRDFQNVLEMIQNQEVSTNPDEAITAEEENCEILFNISLCHMQSNQSHALLIFQDLSEILNSKNKGQMYFLSALAELTLGNNTSAEKLLKDAFQCDPESIGPFLTKQTTTILPLNTSNEFVANFPFIIIPFNKKPVIQVRPALSLPRVKLPSLDFSIEYKVKDYFSIEKVIPKPEAPWMNRIRGSIQFTDSIVDIDSDPSDNSDEETKPTLQKGSGSEIEEMRLVKSAMPLRHFSSSLRDRDDIGLLQSKDEDSVSEKEKAPEDIIQLIKAVCKAD